MKRIFKHFSIIVLTAVICLSAYKLWDINERYVREAQIKNMLSGYRPAITGAIKHNQFITELQREVSNDIVGWITIPGTKIDYAFAKTEDNDFYLKRDLYGNYAEAGSIFMDYRCSKDFTDFNTIIYGHNMKNSSMFGDLRLFADEGFFESNLYGTVYLEDGTYTLEFFAYMIVRSDDEVIYNVSAERGEFYEYVKKYARNYREPKRDGRVVTLSTCSYDFNNARIVLLANLIL